MDPFFFISTCIIASLLPFLVREKDLNFIPLIGSTAVFAAGLMTGVPWLFSEPALHSNGLWYADPFAGLLVLVISFVQWTATMTSIVYLREERKEKIITLRQMRWYHALVQLFVLSMFVTVIADNLGLMWIALEATTLTTAFLVAFYTTDGSLEAAWKYILICSVGISLGLLGMLLVFYAAATGSVASVAGISWVGLHAAAASLPPEIMKLAFAFILVGFGTKMGLVPMHTWLPDAHARTPSPISGMLSGVLLNAALFAILRYKSLVDGSLGSSSWTDSLLVFFGALSFVVPAAFILVQENYKRLLAYSSIEHMGFTMFAFGLGPVGMAAGIIHIVGHALSKSLLFFAAGNFFLRFKHTTIERIGNVLRALPYSGPFFLIGMLALLAIPPSPLFVSEVSAIGASVGTHPLYTLIILLAGVIIVAGFISLIMPLLIADRGDVPRHYGERWNLSHTAMACHLILLLGFGIFFMTRDGFDFAMKIASYLS
jgi:hydrogenase-4 component F